MLTWAHFPRNRPPSTFARSVVGAFEAVADKIDSEKNDHLIKTGFKEAVSDAVLAVVAPQLRGIGFRVEAGKKAAQKISVPVLFKRGGEPEKTFDADAWHEAERFVVEVEAGRGVANNQFLKDIFQACMMSEVEHLCIAVRNVYKGAHDFETVYKFLDSIYTSGRLHLPLKAIVLVGY